MTAQQKDKQIEHTASDISQWILVTESPRPSSRGYP